MKRITIAETAADFSPEPLVRPFGFKGGSLTELWQTRVRLASAHCAGEGLGGGDGGGPDEEAVVAQASGQGDVGEDDQAVLVAGLVRMQGR